MTGTGIENALDVGLKEVSATIEATAGGGGALTVGGAGRLASGGGGGGADSDSVETVSPADWKSGGSTYLLKRTLPPKSKISSRWISAEIVRNRDARSGRRNRSKWDWGWSGIYRGWGKYVRRAASVGI
jgi:hypothetical protein